MLAAIQGLECQAIGADDEAVLVIEKVHGQEGLVRAVFEQTTDLIDSLLRVIAGVLGEGLVGSIQRKLRRLVAIQLRSPG
ncbi:hypothetical protein D3C75_546190 [compost metagenome]